MTRSLSTKGRPAGSTSTEARARLSGAPGAPGAQRARAKGRAPHHVNRCHHYHRRMARWQPNAPGRLEEAALELYGERGFDQPTGAEIPARAGLTERTFFRHYTDKREVLFAGGTQFQQAIVGAAAD